MQTFLPYSSFHRTAECLDRQRLGKLRLECRQILHQLGTDSDGTEWEPRLYFSPWWRHPAVRMWEGHESSLRMYMRVIIGEWIARGYRNTMVVPPLSACQGPPPPWLGDETLHSSHRSALLHKKPDHYCRMGWADPPVQDYQWPWESIYR